MLKNRNRNLYDYTKSPILQPSSMAEVFCLHLHQGDDEDSQTQHFSPDLLGFDLSPSDLHFSSPEYCLCGGNQRNPLRINSSNPFDPENQVISDFDFDLDLDLDSDMVSNRAERSCSSSRVAVENDLVDFDRKVRIGVRNEDIESDNVDTDFELGLGLGFHFEDVNYDDCGGRSETYFMGGFSVAGSDEDQENEIVAGVELEDDFGIDDEANLTLCWDGVQLEEEDDDDDHVRWDVPVNHDIEWEQVDGGGVDVREVLNVSAEVDGVEPEDGTWQVFLDSQNLEANHASVDDLDWEFFGRDLADQNDDYNDVENDMLFGQYVDNGDTASVQPPASKRVIDNLVNVVMTVEDVENNNTHCAVCKDEIGVGEMAKQLLCGHHYHEDCIVPWLRIRNTCPVCRHELPTDDPNYERRKAERVAGAH